jgi:type I restriction enzyme S subunit
VSGACEGGWQRGKLGELLPLRYGKGLPEKSRDSSGSVPVFGSSGQVGQHSQPLTSGPTLIVGRKGTVGAVYLSPEPCWPIDTVYFAEAEEGQNLKYYKYLLDSLNLVRLDRSTAVPGLSRDDYNAVQVTIAPPREQKRIVAEIEKQLSRLDEAVANLKRVKANLKRQRSAILKSAVAGTLVPDGGAAGWKQEQIGAVGAVISGLTKNPKRQQLPRKMPYLRVANVYANELRLDEIEEIGVADHEIEKLLLKPGDLLVVEGNGSPDQIGRVALWDGSIPNCVHQNHLIKIRFGKEVLPDWAMTWLLSPGGRHEIEQVSSSTSGLHTLSSGKIARLPIPLPRLAEQQRIVAEVDRRLSIVREVDVEVDANLKRAQSLRQATLHAAFGGAV